MKRIVVLSKAHVEVARGIGMYAWLKVVVLLASVASCCAGCAPKESFSWIDRHCFIADWTNHHSCVSCCRNGGCGQAYPNVEYPMLVLGDQPAGEVSPQAFDDTETAGDDIAGEFEPTTEDR